MKQHEFTFFCWFDCEAEARAFAKALWLGLGRRVFWKKPKVVFVGPRIFGGERCLRWDVEIAGRNDSAMQSTDDFHKGWLYGTVFNNVQSQPSRN